MELRRGDVVRFDYDRRPGSSMKKERPAVVIQNDVGNRMASYTIIAAVHEDSGRRLPVHVPLPKGSAGLTKDSVVDLGHLATVPRAAVAAVIGRLGSREMFEVDRTIRVSLALR